jgi:hypothetical protein
VSGPLHVSAHAGSRNEAIAGGGTHPLQLLTVYYTVTPRYYCISNNLVKLFGQ